MVYEPQVSAGGSYHTITLWNFSAKTAAPHFDWTLMEIDLEGLSL